ncbi:MAG: SRPBCC domain-containing protein [Longimicrobiales bacterium]
MVRPTPRRISLFGLVTLLATPAVLQGQEAQRPETRPFGSFTFKDSVQVPLPPDEAFDRFLQVDAWWDHRFSENPKGFYIEAIPGGGFFEIFDDAGNGVKHAEVIFVDRGKTLRMRGPLGLSGFALDMVYTLSFQASESGTWVRLDVRGAGELEEGWAEAVQSVWHHFLAERFGPYAQGILGAGPT